MANISEDRRNIGQFYETLPIEFDFYKTKLLFSFFLSLLKKTIKALLAIW